MRRHILSVLAALCIGMTSSAAVFAGAQDDCNSDDFARRIAGCSEIIQSPGSSRRARADAYAMRALTFSMQRKYAQSLLDYDEALRLDPGFSTAWNNRAWNLFKSGRAARGLPDVQRSLALRPFSPHALDTRAHIYQVTGLPDRALMDYIAAIRSGGKEMTRLYQCGLQERGLYSGLLDGIDTPELQSALKICVYKLKCDPLPDDENCRRATS